MSELLTRISRLSPNQLKLLRLKQGKPEPSGELERVSREGELELSFAQQRLWFIDQLEPGSSAYNVPLGVRLRGKLKVEALERAIGEIVRRHEVLRTTFPAVGGEPRQRIDLWEEMEEKVWQVEEVGGEEQEREQRVREEARREAGRGFNLGEGPLVRVKLLRLGEEEHVLLVTLHHIVSDGWSLGVLVEEFGALYEAYAEGKESPLEELKIQYADYAEWQRRWWSKEVEEREMKYWREQLRGARGLELAGDYARPQRMSGKGERVKVELGEQWREKLERLGGSME